MNLPRITDHLVIGSAAGTLCLPHRRWNSLSGEWVSVSPHRTDRPWQGSTESPIYGKLPQYDPHCYLCPGNQRANGGHNPSYSSTYSFTNDFAAFLPEAPEAERMRHPLLAARNHSGTCRVLCFSPRHDLTLAQMQAGQIRSVIDLWVDQVQELGRRWQWVQVFENKGQMMGCSNPHPHGQIWATDFLPNEPSKELLQQRFWFREKGTPLLIDYAALEIGEGERIILRTKHWLAVVPWWAVWPFETLLLPCRHVLRMTDLTENEREDLAHFLQQVLAGYDRLFLTSFPYSMGWHGAPTDDGDYSCCQLHAHIYPPLLRSATVKKFMVGFEMLGEPQRDLTPERAAELLRNRF